MFTLFIEQADNVRTYKITLHVSISMVICIYSKDIIKMHSFCYFFLAVFTNIIPIVLIIDYQVFKALDFLTESIHPL